MTPERIDELRDWLEDNTGYEVDSIDAVEIIAECLAEIERLQALIPRWIPVTERLPPAQESVLVKFHYQPSTPALMYRWGDQWWHDPNHNEPDRNIAAWMPLPPDEEGEKK